MCAASSPIANRRPERYLHSRAQERQSVLSALTSRPRDAILRQYDERTDVGPYVTRTNGQTLEPRLKRGGRWERQAKSFFQNYSDLSYQDGTLRQDYAESPVRISATAVQQTATDSNSSCCASRRQFSPGI